MKDYSKFKNVVLSIKITVLVAFCSLLPGGTLNGATVIHEFGALSGVTEDVFFAEGTADQSTSDLVYTVSSQTVGGEVFSYTFIMAAGTGVADLTLGPNIGPAGATNLRFDDGDQITLSVTGVSNANVVFDGFVGIGMNFAGATGVGFTVDGSDTYATGSTTDPRFGAAPDSIVAAASTTITFNQGTDTLSGNLRGVALQFSSVPEPSTFALLMVGGFGLALLRRRR